MKIAASQLTLQSSHVQTYQEETHASLQIWSAQEAAPQLTPSGSRVTLSTAGKTLSSSNSSGSDHQLDPVLQQIKDFIEHLTGRPIKIFFAEDPSAASTSPNQTAAANTTQPTSAQPAPSGPGMSLEYHQTITETESTQVEIGGTVQTADGKTINLNLQLSMNRTWTEQTDVNIQAGSPRRTDPLVLNFGGTAAQLQDQRFQFDLNGDGTKDDLPALTPGSAYLAFDRNGNGKIDNGTELFGPASGSGFSELAALDSDKNGWIDENDAAFSKLSLWTPQSGDDTTGSLQSLAAKGVGALYLGSTDSHFELRGANNSPLGNIAKTGIYLNENGSGGSLQEVDLTA
ncbi:MAG TPA: VCBS repeat-containing protein [Rhodocyclaceae bacterium]|nr:VCBS repeat-containing protein [Rhodocyclaceae bacterium]